MKAPDPPELNGVPTPAASPRHYGKYQGTVVNNLDPLRLGRITAQVPDVAAVVPLSWALPCTPYPAAGTTSLIVPPIGSQVWIEFEAGNVDHPIWSGCYWAEGQPALLQLPPDERSPHPV